MKNATAVRLLIAQTVLMVGLAWAVVYLGRDEYRLAVGREDDDLPSASQVKQDDDGGLPEVRLSEAAQRQVGIEVADPVEAELAQQTTLALSVVDAQPLAELRTRLLAAQQAVLQARAAAQASEAERRRVQALFNDDRNASQRSLDAAVAQATADAAQARGAQGQLGALRDAARASWGPTLADWLMPADAPSPGRQRQGVAGSDGSSGKRVAGGREAGSGKVSGTDTMGATSGTSGTSGTSATSATSAMGAVDKLAALFAGREVLLRAVLRADDASAAPARLQFQRPGRSEAVVARLLGAVPGPAAAAPEAMPGGRHLLFLAPGNGLSAGMRLQARTVGGDAGGAKTAGMTVPASAVIWHAGQPWIYVRESGAEEGQGAAAPAASPASVPAAVAAPLARFQRRGVPTAQRVGEQWFIPGLTEDDPVVVRGAQVLLSEELKFQIKNENDD